jgi:serine/threonine protein kinase
MIQRISDVFEVKEGSRIAQPALTEADESTARQNFCRTCRRPMPASARRCPRDGDRLVPLPTALPVVGDILEGCYRLEAVLAEGGTSVVFSAVDQTDGSSVALKVLRPDLAENELVRGRFLDAVHHNRRIEHEGVLQLLDGRLSRCGRFYLLMPRLSGVELSQLVLARGGIPYERVIELARQVLWILNDIHRDGLVHLDLKPENLFITDIDLLADLTTRLPRVVLYDFGNAMRDGTRLPARMLFQGTPSYMAPEWIVDRHASTRADLYCAGLVLFEALSGKPAFDDRDPHRIMEMQVNTPLPYSLIMPKLPAAYRGRFLFFLSKLVEKDMTKRFASAREALETLEASLTNRPKPLPEERKRAVKPHGRVTVSKRRGPGFHARTPEPFPEGEAASELVHVVVRLRASCERVADEDPRGVIDEWKSIVEAEDGVFIEDSGDFLRVLYGWSAPVQPEQIMGHLRRLWEAERPGAKACLSVGVAMGDLHCLEGDEALLPELVDESVPGLARRLAGLVPGDALVVDRRFLDRIRDQVDSVVLRELPVREGGLDPAYLVQL